MYNEGISIPGDLLEVGVPLGVIQKSGNTYEFSGERLGLGREAAKTYLRERPPLMKAIRKAILEAKPVDEGTDTIEEPSGNAEEAVATE
jgi:recombination protein RecA